MVVKYCVLSFGYRALRLGKFDQSPVAFQRYRNLLFALSVSEFGGEILRWTGDIPYPIQARYAAGLGIQRAFVAVGYY